MPLKPPPPTHFLCIPLVTPSSRPQLSKIITAFRSDVCNPSGYAIPEDAVRPVGTLHLTLGVFSFAQNGNGNAGLERAVELLRNIKLRDIWARVSSRVPAMPGTEGNSDARGKGVDDNGSGSNENGEGSELRITLRGLQSMQAPSKAAVLYAPPIDPMGRLQAFCEEVRRRFLQAELMTDDKRPLLLHATIVNTVYVRGGSGRKGKGGSRGKWERLTLDATDVLDRYEDEVWMEDVKVESVAICKMGAKPVVIDGVDDEAYEVEAEVSF